MRAGAAAVTGQQNWASDQPFSAFLGIGGVVVAVVFSALAASLIRMAWGAWRDPDWEPSRRVEPRIVLAAAIVMSSLAVAMVCFDALYWMPGRTHGALVDAAAILITLCILGVFTATGCAITIREYGRPGFLIPPRVRRAERLRAEQPWQMAADPLTASLPAEPWALGEVSLLNDECCLADDYTRVGRLQLTTDRIIFQRYAVPAAPARFEQARTWSLTDVRTMRPRARRTLSISFADGTEERFLLQSGNRDRWLRTIANARGIAPQ